MGYENVAVDSVGNTDFVKIAEGFDIDASWIDEAESFKTALQAALVNSKSTLLACRIGRKSYDGKI